jgi:two-component system LytT family response regulator
VLRALLVDDEPAAIDRMRALLAEHGGVVVVGEAGDGETAIERIVELAPDVVFLDVQMPRCNGLEVAASLADPRPRIVFCTAYDEYAVDAFELHAVDYLLKPVARARLAHTLARLAKPDSSRSDEPIERVAREAGAAPGRFLARHGARWVVVPREQVLCFTSEDGLTALYTAGRKYWMQPTLADLERRLDPGFFRISRAAVVLLDSVREVLPRAGGQGELTLADGTRLEVSRRRFPGLLRRLEG